MLPRSLASVTARIIPLGSGASVAAAAANKAALLDRAALLGLPVPVGYIVLETAWQQLQRNLHLSADKQRDKQADTKTTPELAQRLADILCPWLAARQASGLWAVRSAFAAEDQAQHSQAGRFRTVLRVAIDDPAQLAEALETVWRSGESSAVRRDILLMPMVAAHYAGVAFSEAAYEDDALNVCEGTAEQLVAGNIPGQRLELPRLRAYESRLPWLELSPWQQRLQQLLRDLRQHFGDHAWDIEWADDGQHCYLLQLRPITRPSRRDEIFTSANHKEILPALPSRFMSSLIASCAEQLFSYYRRFDARLPDTRPFIELFGQRPYINLSLLSDMMRVWGLPTRLVSEAIGGEAGVVAPLYLRRLLRKLPTLWALAWEQSRAASRAQSRAQYFAACAQEPQAFGAFAPLVERAQQHYVLLVQTMFSLTAASSLPVRLLRQWGMLEHYSREQASISSAMLRDLEPLQQRVAKRPDWQAQLRAQQLPQDPQFQQLWQAYLRQHGHRGIYESDLARPRFHEAPATLLELLCYPPKPRAAAKQQGLALSHLLSYPLWWQAKRNLNSREYLRYQAMRAFDSLRRALLAQAQQAVLRGQLRQADELWLLNIDEVLRLDQGWQVADSFIAERRAEIAALGQQRPLDVFSRFNWQADRPRDTPSGTGISSERPRYLYGIGLTTGQCRGRAWLLSEPSSQLPADFRPEETILVAPSVDIGWSASFARVAGVVVETGGDLSHGSIILRELGLPAITNVQNLRQHVQFGEWLKLDGERGMLERLEQHASS